MATTKAKKRPSRPRTKARKAPITPEDILKLRFLGDPQMSPDGSRIAFVRKHVGNKNNYVSNIWVVDTDGESEPRLFTGAGKDSHPRWSPCGSKIAFIGGRQKGCPQIFTMSADGGEATALTDFPEGTISSFRWAPDGSRLAVQFRELDPDWTEAAIKDREAKGLHDPPRVIDDAWYRYDGDGYFNAQRFRLHLVDATSGARRMLYAKDTIGFFNYDWSPDSRQIVMATNRDKRAFVKPWKAELIRINCKTGKLIPIPLPDGPKSCPRWSPDGKRIAYAGRLGTDGDYSVENLELFVCDAIKGKTKSLTKKTDYCLLAITIGDTAEVEFGPGLQWRPDGRRILVKIGWHGCTHIAQIKPSGGDLEFLTSGNVDYDMGTCADDGHSIALTHAMTTAPSEVLVGTLDNDSIETTPLTNFNGPLLKQRTVSKPKSAWVKTADGTKVQVWTMYPPNFNPRRRYPAVLQIHGGPHAQYGVGFFHEFQTLASEGYVVFYSNPRGSKGYGRDHTAAIHGDWGTADWVDMQAVIQFMKDHRNVNAKKMGVMGGSYGGYMTNWIIGHCHDFAGAITDRCVSNMVSMGGSSDWVEREDGFFPGNFWSRPEARWKQSPIAYFGEVRTPTLIIHSEGDLRCNIEQAEQVHTCLSLRNIPNRFVRYPRTTSHGMSRGGPPDMRLHRLGQIVDWWRKYLK